MVNSMTGFASASGGQGGFRWSWEIRSVNAKGLDIRLRVPDWIGGLEQAVRGAIGKRLARGNVNLTLKLSREAVEGAARLDPEGLQVALRTLAEIEAAARAQGLPLAPTSAAEILQVRGVQQAGNGDDDSAPLLKALIEDLPSLLESFVAMRAAEGQALQTVLEGQLQQIEALTHEAATLAEARAERMAQVLRDNLARVLQNADGADADRVAQELALIAVKSDVREELDRLGAHVQAARDLLNAKGPIGRKLDFLMQEFNREANTLCSKSQSTDLTRVGLDLKTTIDQMREQVQNVE